MTKVSGYMVFKGFSKFFWDMVFLGVDSRGV